MPTTLYSQKELPDAILDMVEGLNWNSLIDALKNGLPANLISLGDVSLYERVLAELESSRPERTTASLEGPIALLETFIEHGLNRGVFPGATMTAVGLACVYGQWKWIPRLIEAGFEIEGSDICKSSVLHALIDGRYQRSFDLHDNHNDGSGIQVGIPLSVDTPEEIEKATNTVTLLAKKGVRLEALDEDEELRVSKLTPLGRAVHVWDTAAVQGLLLAGADLTALQEADGFTGRALDLAIMKGADDIARLLLNAGAPMDANPGSPWFHSNPARTLPLCLAASMGRKEIIEDIIGKMDPEGLADAKIRALQLAAGANELGAFKELLILGVPIDACTKPGGFTPLHQAAVNGSTTVIDFLLEQGVPWNVENANGVSAGTALLQAQPHLAKHYGLQNTPSDNIRYLGLRRSMKR